MKLILRLLGFLALTGAAFFARTGNADDLLSWKHPTQYQDNSALPLADIDGTVIRWADSPSATTLLGSLKVTGVATTASITRDVNAAGTVCYQVATVLKTGVQSSFAPGAWVCKTQTVQNKKPKVPTALKVT